MKLLEFIKDPATKDEGVIAKVLEKYAVAIISRDTETLKSLISNNAMIKSDAIDENVLLERDEFIRRASVILNYIFFYSFINIVSCSAYWWLSKNHSSKIVPLQFGFIKKNNAWLINKIEYTRDMITSLNDPIEALPNN